MISSSYLQGIRSFISLLRLLLRWPAYVFFLVLGYWCLGPLAVKQEFAAVLQTVQTDPILSMLFDPLDLILDPLVSSLSVLFLVWGIAIAAYVRFKEELDLLNEVLAFANLLTGGVANVLLYSFWLFAGVALFCTWKVEGSLGLSILLCTSALFGIPGLFFRYVAKLKFVRSKMFDQSAPCLSVVFLFLAAACFIYGVASDLVPYIRVVFKHVPIGIEPFHQPLVSAFS